MQNAGQVSYCQLCRMADLAKSSGRAWSLGCALRKTDMEHLEEELGR